jgi:hypothetical protein
MQLEDYKHVDLSVGEPQVKQRHLVQGLLYSVYELSLLAFFQMQTCRRLHRYNGERAYPE